MSLSTGMVTRVVADFFDVAEEGAKRRCRARGMVKRESGGILVGDRVTYSPLGVDEGVIEKVLPRTTQLLRPPIANVDQALIVCSLVSPDFNARFVDKVLLSVLRAGLHPVFAFTKVDLVSSDVFEMGARPYRKAGYQVIGVATKQNKGVSEVTEALLGKVSVFAGPSGAGKSTLANAIVPGLGLKMGEVSDKIGRGKHTTRHVELFNLREDSYIADAPGFSQLNLDIPPAELRRWYPEFLEPSESCLYRGCLHYHEDNCGVKDAVNVGRIEKTRYETYRDLLAELILQEERRY